MALIKISNCRVLLFTILTFSFSTAILTPTSPHTEVDIFVSGAGGYFCFKIPTIFQAFDGTLLAFSEARGGECWDWDATDIVLSFSENNGQNWTELQVVVPGLFEHHRVAGNIAPVQDRSTGRLWLPFNRGNIEAWTTYSDDNGRTWARPRMIDNVIEREWTWVGFGPPAGLQTRSGRLIVPAYYSTSIIYDNGLLTNTYVMYSDDNGTTWHNSEPVANGFFSLVNGVLGNENQVVELQDGRLLMNSRTIVGGRLISYSSDDGETWTEQRRTNLPSPLFGVQGSTLAQTLGDGSELLYYSGPDSSSEIRLDMTLFASVDAGRSWSRVLLVEAGQVGYSSLVHMQNGNIAVLYGFSEEVALLFIPGKIVLKIYEDNETFTGPASSFPQVSYNDTWQEDFAASVTDYFETADYYALVSFNQILGIFAVTSFGAFLLLSCTTLCCPVCCPQCSSKRCSRLPRYHEKEEPFGGTSSKATTALNILTLCFFLGSAFVCLVIGLAANASQYLFKYDDPDRYSRQALNGLTIGYLVSMLIALLYGTLYFRCTRKQTEANENLEELKPSL